MASMIAAEAGKKGSEIAAKALTGDIYTRRWTSEKGKGKKKRVIEHELKVNALSAALVAVGAAATAAIGMTGLWMAQRKLTVTQGKDMIRIYDWHDAVVTTTTVQVPHTRTTYIHGNPKEVTTYTTETKVAVTKQPYGIIRTQQGGVPIKYITAKAPAAPNYWDALSTGEKARGWRFAEVERTENFDWGHRYVLRFHNDKKSTLGTDGRPGFGSEKLIDIGL